ncbi:MAG: prepilin-type N-terminal cleavage/methylation domain-containing protein [Planctomycetota bacterium]
MFRRSARQLGFTLIELLVVISIIALLISILLPALGAARGTAKTIACLSNQRQIGIAFHSYFTNHDGLIPFADDPTAPGTAVLSWDDALTDELGHTLTRAQKQASFVPVEFGSPILTCPADEAVREGPPEVAIRTYAMPQSGLDFTLDPREARGLGAAPGPAASNVRRTQFSIDADVPAASSTILLTEYPRTGGIIGGKLFPPLQYAYYNIQGSANGATIESAKQQLLPAVRDMLGLHSKDRWHVGSPEALGYLETGRIYNYLKADGSASSDTPYETAGSLFDPRPNEIDRQDLKGQWTRDPND